MSLAIVQVGAGIRGRHWLQFYKESGAGRCVALVEPSAENVDLARPHLGEGCNVHPDLEGALAASEAGAAVICSPDTMHAEQAIRCLESGLGVMIEKPFAPTVDDAARVLEAARRIGRPLMIAEQYRFFRAERTLRKLLVEDEILGRVDHAHMIDRRNMPAHTEGAWLREVEFPQLQAIGVHHFDTMRMLFGKPASMAVRGWNAPWSDYRGHANSEAWVSFENGVEVQYTGTLRSHRFGFSFYVEGEKGALWTDRKRVFHRKGASRVYWPVKGVPVPKGDERSYPWGGMRALFDDLVRAVDSGAAPETTGDDNIWSIAMLEAGRRAHAERRTVDLREHWASTRMREDVVAA